MDIDSIPIGVDFRQVIEEHVSQCQFFLVVIGPRWLTPRLHHLGDFVRMEVEAALRRGIPVVPVLVDGASMPRPEHLPEGIRRLAYQNATTLRPGRQFAGDMEQLVKGLHEAESWTKRKSGHAPPPGGDDSPKFRTRCPQCSIRLSFQPEQAGKTAKCSKCLVPLVLPKVDWGEAVVVASLAAPERADRSEKRNPAHGQRSRASDSQSSSRRSLPLRGQPIEDDEEEANTKPSSRGRGLGRASIVFSLFSLATLAMHIYLFVVCHAAEYISTALTNPLYWCGLFLHAFCTGFSFLFSIMGFGTPAGKDRATVGCVFNLPALLSCVVFLVFVAMPRSTPTTGLLPISPTTGSVYTSPSSAAK